MEVVDDPDHALSAVRTAQEIEGICRNEIFNGETLKTRCGINTGEINVGAFGAQDRLAFTVHGDNVNIAARLEQLASPMSIAATEGVVQGIASRTDYDLKQHAAASGQRLDYEDPNTRERYVPYVVEPSFVGRQPVELSGSAVVVLAVDQQHLDADHRHAPLWRDVGLLGELLLEAVEAVLPGVQKIVVPPEAAEGALDLLLLGDRGSPPPMPLRQEDPFERPGDPFQGQVNPFQREELR